MDAVLHANTKNMALCSILFWSVVSTQLKNISRIRNLPQVGVKNNKYLKPPPSYCLFRPTLEPTFLIEFNLLRANLSSHLIPWQQGYVLGCDFFSGSRCHMDRVARNPQRQRLKYRISPWTPSPSVFDWSPTLVSGRKWSATTLYYFRNGEFQA